MLTARLSALPRDELVVLDGRRAGILALITEGGVELNKAAASTPAPESLTLELSPVARQRLGDEKEAVFGRGARSSPVTRPVVLSRESIPLAVLPMRLNPDAVDDLVVVERGRAEPFVLLSKALATYEVNAADDVNDGLCDAGHCSLREAIIAANLSAGADAIAFDIPGAGPHTIQVLDDLPTVTDTVTIDGTTEPDFVDRPVVEIDGSNTVGSFGGCLAISASDSVVRGLVINRFAANSAIAVFTAGASNNIVEGNLIGTDVTGTSIIGTAAGVNIVQADNNTVGGTVPAARNVIAGVTLPAIEIREQSDNNVVQGNFIGTDITGMVALNNGGTDVVIYDSQGNTFGGTTASERNIVTGGLDPSFISIGIAPLDTDPTTVVQDNLIQGNFIGTDATGNVGMGTLSAAVYISRLPQQHGWGCGR